MGIADFAAGWALGAKTGNQGFDEVVATGKEILSSKEFQHFVAALRSHAASALREIGDLVDTEETGEPGGDLVDFVRALVERRDAAASIFRWPSANPPAGPPEG
ncbi:MAG TPA: hypothetical protein VGL92_15845 [Acidimicrobiia bacterium]|jgi:hypothetical protein